MKPRDNPIGSNSLVTTILFIVGLLLLALSAFLFFSKRAQLRSLHTTEALVLAAHSSKNDSDSPYTVVRYQVGDETYEHTFSSYVAGRGEGSRTTVAYDPDDPTQVYETGFAGYMVAIFPAFFGLAAVLVSRVPQRLIGALAGRAKRGKTPADRKEPWER